MLKNNNITEEKLENAFLALKKDDEASRNINCGVCGYDKCYDMACAVANGRKDISDCINYLKCELAENKRQLDFYKNEIYTLIDERTEQIEAFQDTITTCIAELINSRDGSDIKRTNMTRKYFEIFIPAIAADDEYRDIFTKQFCADLIRGATLHNIGMISVPDTILRKNGALEITEFEHIKTHTEVGKAAFEKIISQVTDARFLYVAKDMAYYHHEKWNGKGYPENLKGEEIPVSARVMAIVDVYEALTSKKAYKDSFSHELSMQIIAEGRGIDFDPSLTDIFLSISDKIKEVHDKYC